jgi:uncharacterized iron-regulated membrane protein
VVLARWGSAAWIVGLFVLTTLPWQLLWGSDRERALLHDDRAYVLAENDTDLLVYDADEGATVRFAPGDVPGLQRMGITGYLFEESAAFESHQPECVSIAFP